MSTASQWKRREGNAVAFGSTVADGPCAASLPVPHSTVSHGWPAGGWLLAKKDLLGGGRDGKRGGGLGYCKWRGYRWRLGRASALVCSHSAMFCLCACFCVGRVVMEGEGKSRKRRRRRRKRKKHGNGREEMLSFAGISVRRTPILARRCLFWNRMSCTP